MTKPEMMAQTNGTLERSKASGAESLHMYDAARQAIEETRLLLMEVARQTRPHEEGDK